MPKVLNARQAGTKPAADRVYVGREPVNPGIATGCTGGDVYR
jgi:hypothetical protein